MVNSLNENQETERMCFAIEASDEEKSSCSLTDGSLAQLLIEQNKEEKGLFLQEQFDQYLSEAIDEAMTTLGEAVKSTLYQHLDVDFSMPKQEIPRRIDEFDDIIHKIFGLGACRLEIKFMKILNLKICANSDASQCELPLSKWIVLEISFKDYVKNMRKDFEKRKRE